MGEPIFCLRMWLGIPVRSRELSNSIGYCAASKSLMALATDLYSFSSPRNSFMSQVLSLVTFLLVGWGDDRPLSQPLWLGTICGQVRIDHGLELLQVGHTFAQLCWDVDGVRICRESNPAVANYPEQVGKISSRFVAAQVSPYVGVELVTNYIMLIL